MKILAIALRLVVGGIFLWAGITKVIDPAGFATNVVNYRVLPDAFVNLLAVTLPWIEIIAGLLLVLGIWMRASALVIAVLTCVFLVAVGQAVARELNINCGCFGTMEGRKVGLALLAQDAALLVTAAWLAWRADD